MGLTSDPLDWSVQDVVDALCTSRHWWTHARPNALLPDPAPLESHLREEEVDGLALLTYFTTEQRLKEGLGIKTIGKVSAVFWAIGTLRGRSAKYAEHMATVAATSAPPSMAHGMAGWLKHDRSGRGWLGSLPHPSSEHIQLATPTQERSLPPILPVDQENTNRQRALEHTPAKRSRETTIEDSHGPKRRRLTLGTPSPMLPQSAPTKVKIYPSRTYRRKFPVDEIFYGDASFGQTLEDDDDRDFQHIANVPHHLGQYVYRQYCHFIRNSTRQVYPQANGRTVLAIQPYRSTVVPDEQPRSVTVYESTDHGIRATRQQALRLQTNIPFDSTLPYEDGDQETSQWYSLAERWARRDDRVLPLLGESDDEEYCSSHEAELEADQRETDSHKVDRAQLTKDQVSTIVQERVDELINFWRQNKLPLRQNMARSIWRRARSLEHRRLLRRDAASQVSWIDRRLDKLKEAIADKGWHKRQDVIRQCACLDGSISQREELSWQISIWNLKVEPPGPTRTHRRITGPVVKPDDLSLEEGEAGDLILSESELSSQISEESLEEDGDLETDSTANTQRRPLAHVPTTDTMATPKAHDYANPNTVKHAHSPLPLTPEHSTKPTSTADFPSLPEVGNSSSPTPTPTPSSSRSIATSSSATRVIQTDPERSTIEDINSWGRKRLERTKNAKGILLKILRTTYMDATTYARMRSLATSVTCENIIDQVWQLMSFIRRGESLDAFGSKSDDLVNFAKLYVCWNKSKLRHWYRSIDELTGIITDIVTGPDSKHDFNACINYVCKVLNRFPCPGVDYSSDAPAQNHDDQPLPADTPHKRRKKTVQESNTATTLRRMAQKRAEAQVKRERAFQEIAASSHSNSNHLIVNPGAGGREGAVHINQSIGSMIKSHQIEGVKFMWRELVEAGHDDAQGCLLAHTMGLGKTMQVITLLIAIVDAATSPHEHIRSQVPPQLRRMQALVLCPASLVNNWIDELYKWVAKPTTRWFPTIGFISAEDAMVERSKKITKWASMGGILIISYEMFRNMISDPNAQDIREKLLDGPSIIIADEAHRLKSLSSGIRQMVDKLSSKTRVALTGSPLANNLIEYWSMVDWISPGYLGTQKEFRAHFVEPIEEGLYKDSTPYEHRKALKKLHVLKNEIGPKVSRANIMVLKDDLKPKVEFVITVPLTSLQEELYKLCIWQVVGRGKEMITTPKMWQWMYLLTTLCSSPSAFVRKLRGVHPVNEESDVNVQQDVADDARFDEESKTNLPISFIKRATSIFDGAESRGLSQGSYKMDIILEILKLSKAAGDRTLIFSHQLMSLDYLEGLLTVKGYKHVRLDGKTKMSARPGLMDKFNNGEFDVFLISTKAGGTGFNLQGANRVIVVDFGFNPQNEEQAIGRAYRIGQDKEVFVYRIHAGGTFEPKVWNTALYKTQLASRVVDTKNPERQAAKMRAYFVEPDAVEQEDLTEHRGKDPKVLDKILAQYDQGKTPVIRAMTTTETLMTEDADAVLNEQENEEVKKMIEAERLRKEDPQAWEQYLRDNPSINDGQILAGDAFQKAPFQAFAAPPESASSSQAVAETSPGVQASCASSHTRPYIEFGVVAACPIPDATVDSNVRLNPGINNAAPTPATIKTQSKQASQSPKDFSSRNSARTPTAASPTPHRPEKPGQSSSTCSQTSNRIAGARIGQHSPLISTANDHGSPVPRPANSPLTPAGGGRDIPSGLPPLVDRRYAQSRPTWPSAFRPNAAHSGQRRSRDDRLSTQVGRSEEVPAVSQSHKTWTPPARNEINPTRKNGSQTEASHAPADRAPGQGASSHQAAPFSNPRKRRVYIDLSDIE